jgi:hypothetical protein
MNPIRPIMLLAIVLTVGAAGVTGVQQSRPRSAETLLAQEQQQQVYGGYCQTQFGICPLRDPQGNPITLPVGTPCFCGSDPGWVRQ